mgnify:CR=1 FL=1
MATVGPTNCSSAAAEEASGAAAETNATPLGGAEVTTFGPVVCLTAAAEKASGAATEAHT